MNNSYSQTKILQLTIVIFCMITFVTLANETVPSVVYSPHAANDSCHMNMGPTGATAWMRGYYLLVASIQDGSPADGSLMLGDLVIAAEGTDFGPDADPRITLGNAIGRAEVTGNTLSLKVVRDGSEQTVAVKLPRLGAFSSTWPADCEKSEQILDTACLQLLNAQMPDGEVVTDGKMGTFYAGLLLLASGDPKYLDGARRAAYSAASTDYASMPTNNWPMGYGGVLMAEYYLATGDDTVLPKLQEVADALVEGQMKSGSWGHKSPAAGYGALNQPGIVCAIALILAQECGIDVDQATVDKALDFFGRFAMLGSIPYGDHGPGGALDNNGQSASAAVLMHLAGREAEAAAFSESVAMSYWMREEGHTGGYFSFVWGPLGAALAGNDEFRTFMDYQKWYYNLIRTWQGDLTMLPYHEALTRFDSSAYIDFGGDFTTGGMALVFAMPRRQLRILGAPESVFSPGAELSGELLQARNHYLDRNWDAYDQLLASISPEALSTDQEKRWLAQLQDARALNQASAEQTLLEIESNLVEGAAYRASEQFSAMKRCLGENGDARFAELDERFADGTMAWFVREGEQYYDAWRDMQVAAFKSWVPQGPQAKRLVEGVPTLRMPIWEPLSATSQLTPQNWQSLLLGNDQEPPAGWEKPGFDDSNWKSHDGIFLAADAADGESYPRGVVAARRRFAVENPEGANLRIRLRTVRPAETRVYLNGEMIAEAVRGQRGGYASIELDDAVFDLLEKGENLLAVTSTRQGGGNNRLDVGLEINRIEIEKRTLPIRYADKIIRSDAAERDFTLRVRETKNKMQRELQESYDRKSIDALLQELEEPVAYRRALAENALVKKGLQGLEQVVNLTDHADWKVRSAVCNVMSKARRNYQEDTQGPEMTLLKAQIPALIEMLGDDHFWVSSRAASALAGFGDEARAAAPELLKLINDSDEWVRREAMNAIRALDVDSDVAIAAALKALDEPNTAYTAPRIAVSLLQNHPEDNGARLDALINLLRNPPEGGGGALLNQVMEIAFDLDPRGDKLILALIEAAADMTHYSRQRGNPRRKAIEMLGAYGEQAKAAIPVLKEILSSEAAKDKSQHEPAQEALDAIRGD